MRSLTNEGVAEVAAFPDVKGKAVFRGKGRGKPGFFWEFRCLRRPGVSAVRTQVPNSAAGE